MTDPDYLNHSESAYDHLSKWASGGICHVSGRSRTVFVPDHPPATHITLHFNVNFFPTVGSRAN